MSWLIEEESIDRYVLDDVDASGFLYTAEQRFRRDNDNVETNNERQIENEPPIDFVSLNNNDGHILNTSVIMLDDDQESIQSGVTILPSCSSSSIASHHQQQGTINTRFDVDSSRMGSLMDESGVALSIDPYSIDSSLLTEFSNSPLISSVVSEESVNEGSVADHAADTCSCQNETSRNVMPFRSCDSINSSCSTETDEKPKRWFSRFENEKDWDEFQEKTKQLLEAVDCPLEDRDELIAQLISMEEKMFWESKTDKGTETVAVQSNVSWLLEVAALSASIVVAGLVIVRIIKGR
jgi:hypothetical protein